MRNPFNIWKADVIYIGEDGRYRYVKRLPSGDLHDWLRSRNKLIKYDYDKKGWLITTSLSDDEIKELKNI
jgi:hypothetical protein